MSLILSGESEKEDTDNEIDDKTEEVEDIIDDGENNTVEEDTQNNKENTSPTKQDEEPKMGVSLSLIKIIEIIIASICLISLIILRKVKN